MTAKYIFVGLDANFAIDVETQIPEIVSYLQDGPLFWRNTGKHHPFVLDSYSGSGGLYHENFKLIEFTIAEADQVSFIELIEKPTMGRSNLTVKDLSQQHINRLRNILDNGNAKYIFIPPSVIRLMRKTGAFSWLRSNPLGTDGDLVVWRDKAAGGQSRQIIYEMYHLSNYGKYADKLKRQINQLRKLK